MFFLSGISHARSSNRSRRRRQQQRHPMAVLSQLTPPPPILVKTSAVTVATTTATRPSSRSPKPIPSGLTTQTPTFAPDPASPKIGCMGQVKGTGTSTSTSTPVSVRDTLNSLVKVFARARRGARVRDDYVPTTAAPIVGPPTTLVASFLLVDVGNMDPPLPVVRKLPLADPSTPQPSGRLWERRCGGVPLQGIKLHPVQHLRAC